MDLVRDVLDKLVLDRNRREMGRVDGIVLERRKGMAPRVVALQIGPAVLGHRLHPTLGRWIAAVEQALGIAEGRPVRIPFSHVQDVGIQVKLDLAIGETAVGAAEQRLRAVVARLPGPK
jgi:sporulation protein YlmC with PRC-barrel domain